MTRKTPQGRLRPYQEEAVAFLHARDSAALFLDMGLGKTAICLSALQPEHLPVLVVAPKRVAEEVWKDERDKWRPDLSIQVVKGARADRLSMLKRPRLPAITVISRDVFKDVTDARLAHRWNLLILDELSGFKNRSSLRWKTARAVRNAMNARRVWGLTGTPAPNSLLDLWAQLALLDDGARLGRTLTEYRTRYFFNTNRLPNGVPVGFEPRPGAAERIRDKLSDICLSMGTEGRVDLPPVVENQMAVHLPTGVVRSYRKLQRELVADVHDLGLGREVRHTAVNAASLSTRLSQLSAGFLYHEIDDTASDGTARGATHAHDEKMMALQEVIESAQGSPVLVFYRYRHEATMIQQWLNKKLHIHASTVGEYNWYQNWNARKLPVLLSHPASIGHGLNLQGGGHTIVWTSLPWDTELFVQANKRLHRSGQTDPVVIHMLMSKGTVDRAIKARLEHKKSVQDALMDHLEGVL